MRLRSMGFRISDFADYPGFVGSDFDDLIARGTITVVAQADDAAPTSRQQAQIRTDLRQSSDRGSGGNGRDLGQFLREALRSLARKAPLDQAVPHVPARSGLYAIYGDADTRQQLGLGDPPDERPLYVGKAETSLVARDLATHFGDSPPAHQPSAGRSPHFSVSHSGSPRGSATQSDRSGLRTTA